MKAYYMCGDTLTNYWTLDATVSDTRVDVVLYSVYSLTDGTKVYDRLACTGITIDELLAREDLADNARYILPLSRNKLLDEGAAGEVYVDGRVVQFEPLFNLQKQAFDQGKDHNVILAELQKPVALHLFIPFSGALSSFADCSIGFMLGTAENARCNLPIETVTRFHHRDVWYKPAITGPTQVASGETHRYAVSALFRGEETLQPCNLTASTSAGTLDATDFTLTGTRELTLDTTGVAPGTTIELAVNSRYGTPAFYTTATLTVTVA